LHTDQSELTDYTLWYLKTILRGERTTGKAWHCIVYM